LRLNPKMELLIKKRVQEENSLDIQATTYKVITDRRSCFEPCVVSCIKMVVFLFRMMPLH